MSSTPDEMLAKDIRRVPKVTAAENLELARKIKAGGPDADAARERLISGNLRLVLLMASRYGHPSMSLGDRVQEGTIGLMKAIDKFDPDRGVNFSTYALYWIRSTMDRAMSNAEHAIRLPGNVGTGLRRLKRIENSTHRPLTEEERRSILDMGKVAYRAVQQLPQAYIPLNATVPYSDMNGEGHTAEESIADESIVPQDMSVLLNEIHEVLEKAKISPRELKVTTDYFGGLSYDEIGKKMNLSRERVRQIVNAALAQLRKYMVKRGPKSPSDG